VGDAIVVCFRATRDCYLTLLNLGTSGRLTIRFPNALYPDNLIRAGEFHEIPGQDYGFEYRLQGPPGTERLKAIATLDRVQLLETHFTPGGVLFETRTPTAAARDIAGIRTRIEQMTPSDWAEATREFNVADG